MLPQGCVPSCVTGRERQREQSTGVSVITAKCASPLRLSSDHCVNHPGQGPIINTSSSHGPAAGRRKQTRSPNSVTVNIHDALSAANNSRAARLLQSSPVRMQIRTREGSLTSSLLPSTPESPDNIIHLSLEAEGGWEGGVGVVKRHMCVCVCVCVCVSEIYSE